MKTQTLFIASALLARSFCSAHEHESSNATTTKLTIESWRGNDAELYKSVIIPAFTADHPNIEVEFNGITTADYDKFIREKFANGTAGDLVMLRPFDQSLLLYEDGQLEDITDLDELKNFPDFAKVAWTTDDGSTTYGVPMASVLHGFIYNKDVFDKLGLNVPITEKEFYDVLDAILMDGNYTPLAIGGKGDFEHAYATEKGYMSIGVNYWKGEDGRNSLIAGTQKLTDQGWTEPYRQVVKWLPYMGNGVNMVQDEIWDLFTKGGAAIYPAGSWEISGLVQDVTSFEMGAFRPPVPKEGDECYISDHIDMAMGINAEASDSKKEAARIFLSWLGSKEFADVFANSLPGFFPLSAFNVTVDDKYSNEFISWRSECKSSIRPFSQIVSRGEPSLISESFKATGDLMNGIITPEEATARMQEGLESWYTSQQPEIKSRGTTIRIDALLCFGAIFVSLWYSIF